MTTKYPMGTRSIETTFDYARVRNHLIIESQLSVGVAIDFAGIFKITGETIMSNTLDVSDRVILYSTLSVGKDVRIGGNVRLDQSLNIDGSTSFGSSISVQGPVYLSDTLSVNQNALIRGQLSVNDPVTLSSVLSVSGQVTFESRVKIRDDLEVTGNITATSITYISTIDVADPIINIGLNNVNPTQDLGILMENPGAGGVNKGLIYDVSNSHFAFITTSDTPDTVGPVTITGYDTVKVSSLIITGSISVSGPTISGSSLSVAGSLSVGGSTGLAGALNLDNTLSVSRDVTISSQLSINGSTFMVKSVTLNSELSVGGNLTLTGNETVSGTLSVGGNTTLSGLVAIVSTLSVGNNLIVTGNETVSGTLSVGGDTTMSGTLAVLRSVTFSSQLSVGADVNVAGNLSVSTAVQASSLTLTGNTTLSGLVTIASVLSVGSNLIVTGNETVSGTLSVGGNTTMSGTLAVLRSVTLNSQLSVGNLVTIVNNSGEDGLTVRASQTLLWSGRGVFGASNNSVAVIGTYGNTGKVQIGAHAQDLLSWAPVNINPGNDVYMVENSGNVGIGTVAPAAKLHVSGETLLSGGRVTIASSLSVNSNLTLTGNETVSGTLSVGGNTTMSGTLAVLRSVTLNSQLSVGGDTTVSGTLNVVRSATFSSQMSIGGAVNINGNLSVSGAVQASSLTLTGNTLSVANTVTIASTLSVAGATTLNNVLDVHGSATYRSQLSVGGVLRVAGDTLLTGAISIANDIVSTSSLSVGGSVRTFGTLSVGSNLNVVGNVVTSSQVSIGGHVHIQSTLSVGANGDLMKGNILRMTQIDSTLFFQVGDNTGSAGSSGDLFIGNWYQGTGASARKVMFKADGTVGIGTDNPNGYLQVIGSTVCNSQLSVGGNLRVTGDSILTGAISVANDIVLRSSLSTAQNARIGGTLTVLGSSTYSSQLSVGGAVIADSLSVGKTASTGYVRLTTGGIANEYGDTSMNGYLRVRNVSTDAEILTIPSDPNTNAYYTNGTGGFGIGTSSPSAKLHVSGSTLLSGGTVTIASSLSMGTNVYLGNSVQIHGVGTNGPLIIDPNYAADNYILLYDRAVVSGDFAVTGSATINSNLSIGHNLIVSQTIQTHNNTGPGGQIHNSQYHNGIIKWGQGLLNDETGADVGSDYAIWRYSDVGFFLGNPLLIQRATGRVGIATSSPSAQLHVVGSTLLSGGTVTIGSSLSVGSDLTLTGTLSTGGNTTLSGLVTIVSALSVGSNVRVNGATVLSGGIVTIASSLSVGSSLYLTDGGGIYGNGTNGPLIIDPNFTSTNNHVLIYDKLLVDGFLEVTANAGLNISSPESILHIKQRHDPIGSDPITNYASGTLIIERAANSERWNIGHNNFGDLGFWFASTTTAVTRGYIDNVTDVGSIDFTGQHRSTPLDATLLSNTVNYTGLIVVSTGIYNNLSGGVKPTINESLPVVDLASQYADKRAYGVISDSEDNSSTREYATGAFVSVYQKETGDKKLIINAIGEGAVWVCNSHGSIENGDYITTSNVRGYGAKQNDIYLCNYTVAKITQDEDFSDMTEGRYLNSSGTVISEAEYNAGTPGINVFKAKFVGCTYHCG